MPKSGVYKTRIRKAMQEAGVYKEYFDAVINDCADTLERRDMAVEQFNSTGGSVLVKHTNKSGATNIEQNPALRLVNDLNRDLIKYYNELGLTPAGLKRIDEESMKPRKKSALAEALKELEM